MNINQKKEHIKKIEERLKEVFLKDVIKQIELYEKKLKENES
jgi:hypothetical protein